MAAKLAVPSEEAFNQAKDSRFSPEVHRKLKDASVAVAGLGGLGSNIAVMLARTGIGHLHIVDFDKVDLTNLNRQAYSTLHLGETKTTALTQILLEINPYIRITSECVRVTENNAVELFGDYKIVCEAFDNPDAKAMLVNTLLEKCPNTTVVSGTGLAGYVSANTIRSRKITDRLYVCGDCESDALAGIGLMAPRVSICAGHQANIVVRLILGLKDA